MKEILIGSAAAVLCFMGIQDVNSAKKRNSSVFSSAPSQTPSPAPSQTPSPAPSQTPSPTPGQTPPPSAPTVQQPTTIVQPSAPIVQQPNYGQLVPSSGQIQQPNYGQLVPSNGQIQNQVDVNTWGRNALQLMEESSTISSYGTNLSKYLRYFGHFGKKLPVTNEKIATKMSKEIRPLIDFMKSLTNKKTKASKVKTNWDKKVQGKLSQLQYLSDEFEKVAIVQAVILLNDQSQLSSLANDKQECAKEAGQKLLKFAMDNGLLK